MKSLSLSLSLLILPLLLSPTADAMVSLTAQYSSSGYGSNPQNDKRAVRAATKKARGLVKKTILTRRSVVGMLKRVKDEKSAERSAKSMQRLYEAISEKPSLSERADDDARNANYNAMAAQSKSLEAEAYQEEMKKNARVFERIQSDIDEHLKRIDELGIDSSALRDCADKILKHDFSSNES